MAKTNECWGIEVGTSALKAIKLARSGGEVTVADYEVIPHKQVLTTPELDQQEAIALALDALTNKHDLTKTPVVVSVPGNKAFARFAKLPPVEPKKIPDIVRFEAVQQIPFPIEQVEWDYQVFQQEDSPDVEVGIFAITKERVNEFLRNYRQQGIDVHEITLSPVGVYNAFAHEGVADDDEAGTIIMDIGGVSTDLIIIEGGGIWLRTLPIGGTNFTEALVKAFKLSYRKAEKLKRDAATSKYARQIFQAMRPVFSDLVQEVQKSLGYYQSLNRDSNLTRVIGLGSTFRLPGLQKYLKQQLQMDVNRPTKFKKISVEGKREADFTDHAMNLATAYGLALQGLHLGRVRCNLLPSQILTARMWKAKQPLFAAAAACLLLAAGLAYFSLWNTKQQWRQQASAVDQRFQQVVERAREYDDQWQQIQRQADPRLRIENVRGILDYRGVWSGILRDLSMALDTVDVDPAVYRADYDAIAQLPNQDRRRIYIESVDTTYRGVTDATGPSTVGITEINEWRDPDSIWDDGAIADVAPRFQITVRGFIDANETTAARVLNSGPIRWLETNRNRPDRPYVIDLSAGNVIEELVTRDAPAGSEAADEDELDRPGFGRGETDRRDFDRRDFDRRDFDRRNFERGPQADRRTFGETPQPRRRDRVGESGPTAASSWEQLAPLLPDNPMPRFVRGQVTEFELRWQIVLRSPEAARNPAAAVAEQQEQEGEPGAATGETPATAPEARLRQPARLDTEADA